MRPLLLALAALVSGLGAVEAPVKQQITQGKRDLTSIRREMQAKKRELAKSAKVEKSILRQMEGLNHQVDASRRDLRTHEHNLQIVEGRIATLGRLSQQYQGEAESNRAMLGRGLRLMQRAGPMGGIRLLMSSKDPAELISRYRFLKTLARHNARRVSATRERLMKVDEYAREFRARELELKNHKQNAVQAKSRAVAEMRRRASLLNGVRQKKSQAAGLLKELSESAKNLESKMLELQRAAIEAARARPESGLRRAGGAVELDAGPSRLGRRHSLAWPVRGSLVSRYGEQMHPKFHTKVFNRGIEIAAALGSPVVAAAAGTVKYADYFEGFGQMLILDHGGGYFTVYGHNSQLSVQNGAEVKRGEAIAEVGDSSLSGKSSLYFEIRAGAKAVDPLQWLGR